MLLSTYTIRTALLALVRAIATDAAFSFTASTWNFTSSLNATGLSASGFTTLTTSALPVITPALPEETDDMNGTYVVTRSWDYGDPTSYHPVYAPRVGSWCLERKNEMVRWFEIQIEDFGHTKYCGEDYFWRFGRQCGALSRRACQVYDKPPNAGTMHMWFTVWKPMCGQDDVEKAIREASNFKIMPTCRGVDMLGKFLDD